MFAFSGDALAERAAEMRRHVAAERIDDPGVVKLRPDLPLMAGIEICAEILESASRRQESLLGTLNTQ